MRCLVLRLRVLSDVVPHAVTTTISHMPPSRRRRSSVSAPRWSQVPDGADSCVERARRVRSRCPLHFDCENRISTSYWLTNQKRAVKNLCSLHVASR